MSLVTPTTRRAVPSAQTEPDRTALGAVGRLSRHLVGTQGWLALALTLAISLCVPAALLGSGWIEAGGMLWPAAILAAAVGMLAARSKMPRLLGLLAGLGVGCAGIAIAIARLVPPWPPLGAAFDEFVDRRIGRTADPALTPLADWWTHESSIVQRFATSLLAWWRHGGTGDPAIDHRVLLFLVAVLAWTVVCYFTWAIYANTTPLLAVLPPGTVLVTVAVLSGHGAGYVYLYVLAAFVLLARLHLVAMRRKWDSKRIDDGTGVGFALLAPALLLTLLVGGVALALPAAPKNGFATTFWNAANPAWSRLQSRVGTAFMTTGTVSGNDGSGLTLGGSLSEQTASPVMYVSTDEPPPPQPGAVLTDPTQAVTPAIRYFLGAAYAEYSGKGWQTMPAASSRTGVPLQANGQPDYLGVATGGEATQQHSANQQLQPAAPAGTRVVQRVQVVGNVPSLIYAYNAPLTVNQPVTVHSQGGYPEQIDVRHRVTSYTVVSSVPQVTADQLRAAGQAYPATLAPYLTHPNVPGRVTQLAHQWAAGATTPYDEALAIEAQLRQFPYTLNVPAPPAGQDPVDYFLFDLKRGYCEYYASSMVVMLRDLGVPARIATGYATSTYDYTSNAYVVTQNDAHAWVQVYFPGAGWIDFEPTPANPELVPPPGAPAMTAAPIASPLAALPGSALPGVAVHGPSSFLPFLTVLVLAVGSLLALALRRSHQATRSAEALVRQYYARLLRYSGWRGFGKQPEETPLEFAERLDRLLGGDAGPAARHLAGLYVRLQYGAGTVTFDERVEAQQSWWILRRGLWRRRRLAAT